MKKYGVDVDTIPERAGDDPFGLLDGGSARDSINFTQKSIENKSQSNKRGAQPADLRLNHKAVSKVVKARDIIGSHNIMIENHEKIISQEAKQAEEDLNDPKKKK